MCTQPALLILYTADSRKATKKAEAKLSTVCMTVDRTEAGKQKHAGQQEKGKYAKKSCKHTMPQWRCDKTDKQAGRK